MKTKFWRELFERPGPGIGRTFIGKEDSVLVIFPNYIYLFKNDPEVAEALKKGVILPKAKPIILTRKRNTS